MTRLARSRTAGRLSEKLGGIARNSPALPAGIILCIALTAAALGGLAGVAFGQISGAPASDRASYRDARVQTIMAHLRQFDGDYILAAGDSHIEHWWVRSLCGLPVVNAGLSGATAQSYARFFEALSFPRPPRAIILTIGTNDAQRRRIGNSVEAVARFQDASGTLLQLLGRHTQRVVATAVPPLNPDHAKGFSSRVAASFSGVLAGTCREHGCHFVDPFTPGIPLVDGVHLRDYAGVYSHLEGDLCQAISAPPTLRTAVEKRALN